LRVTFDPVKRAETLAQRDLGFEDAAVIFEGVTVEMQDTRRDYGESRVICYGILFDRMVVVCYPQRGRTRHAFSMPKASTREKARLAPHFAV